MWQPNLQNSIDIKSNPWAVTPIYPDRNQAWQQNGWGIGNNQNGNNGQNGYAYSQSGGCASAPCLNNGVTILFF